MAAKAVAKVGGGIWVWDVDIKSWILAFRAARATFTYSSDITCDLKSPKGNPLVFPAAGPSPKFGPGPTGILWPKWPNGFAGPLGSNADTEASGSTAVYPWRKFAGKYEATMIAGAVVRKVAAGSTAVAISTISDPWRFRFRATRNLRKRNVVGLSVRLNFRSSPLRRYPSTERTSLQGTFGSLELRTGSRRNRKATLTLASGWQAYLAPKFTSDRVRIPKTASARTIERLLLRQPDLHLLFVKNLSPAGGSLTCTMDIVAEEKAGNPAAKASPLNTRRKTTARAAQQA